MGRKKRPKKNLTQESRSKRPPKRENKANVILITTGLLLILFIFTTSVFVLNRFVFASPTSEVSSFVGRKRPTPTTYQSGGPEYHEVIKSVLKKASAGLPEAEELYDFLVKYGIPSEQYLLVRDITRTVGMISPDNSFLFTLSRVPWQGRGPFAAYHHRFRSLAIQDEVINQNILAMILIHELKHVRDHILFNLLVDPNFNDGRYIDDEYRAHELEIKLGNNLSKGAFFRKLDEIITRYKLSHQKPLYSLNEDIFNELNMVFGPFLSSSEEGAREAIYLIALQIRLLEKTNLGEEQRRLAWGGWYRELNKKYGTDQ